MDSNLNMNDKIHVLKTKCTLLYFYIERVSALFFKQETIYSSTVTHFQCVIDLRLRNHRCTVQFDSHRAAFDTSPNDTINTLNTTYRQAPCSLII